MVPLSVPRRGLFVPARAAIAATIALAVAAGCAPGRKGVSPAEARSAIETANRQFMEAFSRRDAAALGLIYAEDGQVLPPGAPPLEGRDAIVTMWQSVLALPIAAIELQTAEVGVGEEGAWEAGRYEMTASDGRTTESGHYVVIWRRGEAGWRNYRHIWNSNAPAAASAPGGVAAP